MIRRLGAALVLALVLWAQPASAAYALLSGHFTIGLPGAGGTTGSFDSSGASLLVAVVSSASGATETVVDSKSNTWTPLTKYGAEVRIWYVTNPTVGSGHTITLGNSSYASLLVAWFSGADTSAPFDVENGASAINATSQAPGSVTPSAGDELILTGIFWGSGISGAAINSSFTIVDTLGFAGGNNYGGGLAYKIKGAADTTSENPTWSWVSGADTAASIATFKAGGGGGGSPVPKCSGGLLLRGVGCQGQP